ncbi:MAG: glycosyltransferase family 4 protein [Candidatus Bathyarchaeia archaeon]
MSDEVNMIIVAMPFPYTGGGGYRALLSIKEYRKRGINPFLVLPWSLKFQFTAQEGLFLLREGIRVYGSARLPRVFSLYFPFRRSLANFYTFKRLPTIKIEINRDIASASHCVMSMHEGVDAITTCLRISEVFSLKRIALLQLPPFYEDPQRLKSIEEARYLWLEAIEDFRMRASWSIIREIERGISKNVKRLLNDFDLVLAVSKSIPMEMGGEWSKKVVPLDPGVALSQEDMQLINNLSRRTREKEKIVVFGGRPSPEKGLIEALIAFREIRKNCGQDFKLAITGRISDENLRKIRAFCDRLGIKDNVLFYGFLPREERLTIVAKSMVMLYPSHTDAFPYAVLESLHLNTPVVAYNIPALRAYYSGLDGITLVKESDIEALAQKTIEKIKGKNIHVEKPKFTKSWNEIMDEEVALIKSRLIK